MSRPRRRNCIGWGWPGLFIFAVVKLNSIRPAAATAFTQTGTAIGAVTGPVVFGRWVEAHSFASGWGLVGLALSVAGAICVATRWLTFR